MHKLYSNHTAQTLQVLIKLGANVNAADKSDNTTMHAVAYTNNVKAMKELYEAGQTPMDMAKENNAVNALEFLEKNIKCVNNKDVPHSFNMKDTHDTNCSNTYKNPCAINIPAVVILPLVIRTSLKKCCEKKTSLYFSDF